MGKKSVTNVTHSFTSKDTSQYINLATSH